MKKCANMLMKKGINTLVIKEINISTLANQ
jgi:hypothetical protein